MKFLNYKLLKKTTLALFIVSIIGNIIYILLDNSFWINNGILEIYSNLYWCVVRPYVRIIYIGFWFITIIPIILCTTFAILTYHNRPQKGHLSPEQKERIRRALNEQDETAPEPA